MSGRNCRSRVRRPAAQAADELSGLIDLLARRQGERALRQFACWCASHTDTYTHSQKALLEAADHLSRSRQAWVDVDELRWRLVRTADDAATTGLRDGSPGAAAFLAAYESTHPDALRAARRAAEAARRWADLDERRRRAFLPVAATAMRQQQIGYALSLLTGIHTGATSLS